jgi:hypothetical protein
VSAYDISNFVSFTIGDTVRSFDPRTLGVVKHGTVQEVGEAAVLVDFGLTGAAWVMFADILGVVE